MQKIKTLLIGLALIFLGYLLGSKNEVQRAKDLAANKALQEKANAPSQNEPLSSDKSKLQEKRKRFYQAQNQDFTLELQELIEFNEINSNIALFSHIDLLISATKKIPIHEVPNTILDILATEDFPSETIILQFLLMRLAEEDGLGGYLSLKNSEIFNDGEDIWSYFNTWATSAPDDLFKLYSQAEIDKPLFDNAEAAFIKIAEIKFKSGLDFALKESVNIQNKEVRIYFTSFIIDLAKNEGLHKELLVNPNLKTYEDSKQKIWSDWLDENEDEALDWGYANLNMNDKKFQRTLLQHGQVEAVENILNHPDFDSKAQSWNYISNSFKYDQVNNYSEANASAIIAKLEADYNELPKHDQFYQNISRLVLSDDDESAEQLLSSIKNEELREKLYTNRESAMDIELDFL